MTITGIDHITLACADARRTIDFYTGGLDQRFTKETVNFDDPGSCHPSFGDYTGSLGSTLFLTGRMSRRGGALGRTHPFALTVADYDGLLMWKRRLLDLGQRVKPPPWLEDQRPQIEAALKPFAG